MEASPDTENVVYIDEYPNLRKKVWLRRLAAQRESGVLILPQVVAFPTPEQIDAD